MPSDLDLHLSRVIDATPERLWRCWTDPALLRQWFTPPPVETIEAEIEPRAGGRFLTRMRLPDGSEIATDGCVLAADPGRLLAFTDALSGGYRPTGTSFMTAIITFDAVTGGTRYRATLLHSSVEDRAKHEQMGFREGWAQTTDQLAALAQTVKA